MRIAFFLPRALRLAMPPLGAMLLGLRGIVVKSHGSADRISFGIAISRAADEVRNAVLEKITDRMSAIQENAA